MTPMTHPKLLLVYLSFRLVHQSHFLLDAWPKEARFWHTMFLQGFEEPLKPWVEADNGVGGVLHKEIVAQADQ